VAGPASTVSGTRAAARRVVVAPNWLGDCVMSLPFLRALRRAQPRDPLAVLTPPGPAELFRAEGSADTVLLRSGLLRDARQLRRGGFREAWLLPNSFRSAVAPRLAGIPERIGYDTDGRGFLLTHPAPRPAATSHQLRDYDALLSSRGIEPDREAPRLPVTAESLEVADSALERAGAATDRPLALLAPGAAFGWTKRWPAERYGTLADLLTARGFACAVVIGPGEASLGAAAAASARSPLPALGGCLDPLQLAALLSRARVVIANDSGPGHLAAAVGTPVVAFFGPTDPGRTAPSGSRSRILDRYVFCSPCFLKSCPYGHECMKEISAEMALRAVEELLGGSEVLGVRC
jgi:lipopolysaccharide heptosyltransferase II